MQKESFNDLVKEVLDCTKEGLDRLVEVRELQEALKTLPQTETYHELLEEIIEKDRIAVSLIQRATLIQHKLMKDQHEAVSKLINNLSKL